MTYRELLELLNSLTDAQLNDDVTIYDTENDEFYPLKSTSISDNMSDVIDENMLVLEI